MSVKDILNELAEQGRIRPEPDASGDAQLHRTLEARLVKLNRCFVETILPGVFEVESDLTQAGFWNQVSIGQSRALSSDKPNIKAVTFYFWPEKSPTLPPYQKPEGTYQALFRPSGDMRQITFAIRFPQRLAQKDEIEDRKFDLSQIDTRRVNDFLERFVKGAIDAYSSDRILR
jgi:hypothetical protein